MTKKENLRILRQIHGALHDWNIERIKNHHIKCLIRAGYKKSLESDKTVPNRIEDYPVDIVVTWVDGNDLAWLAEKRKYQTDVSIELGAVTSRFRNWDNFQYWFRAIEKNAPWVRYIHFVTYGHLPEWLNIRHPKIRIVTHDMFIPKQYLPTFSSHSIEVNLWRIPDLSEHFIYFNDDVFLTRIVEKSDFFCNGLPKYCSIAQPIETFINMNAHRHARFNCIGIMNSCFDISECIEEHPEKWFSYKYYTDKRDIRFNIRAYEDGFISGMYYFHEGIPFRKSTMEDFVNHFPEIVDKTCSHRFRTSDDVMHQAVQMWEIFHGTFEPVGKNYYGHVFFPTSMTIDEMITTLSQKHYRMICINDHENLDDFEMIKSKVNNYLQNRYPEKSAFEKQL